MKELESILTPLALFASVTIVILACFNFILKMQIVRSGHTDENYLKALSRSFEYKLNELKWAILFFFAGLGLIFIEFIPYQSADAVSPSGATLAESPLPYGIEAVFIAAGFFVYYLIVRKQKQ